MVWFALSMQDQVEKYGAYVGIAAFFGLAVLSLLYFAQARELKRLREWAGRAPERAQELEQRVIAQADAARQAVPAATGTAAPKRVADMPVPPPPPPQGAATAQATVEADVLAEETAPSTNGHHDGPVPPPDTAVGTRPEAEAADEDAEEPVAAEEAGGDDGTAEEGEASEAPQAAEADEADDPGAGEPAGADAAEPEADESEADEPADAHEPAGDGDADGPADGPAGEPVAGAVAAGEQDEASADEPPDDASTVSSETAVGERPVEVSAAAAPGAAGEAPEPEDEPEDDADDAVEVPPAIPRATPEQRPAAAARPAAALDRAQPSASPRRPPAPPPRRPAPPAAPARGRSAGTVALLAGIVVLVLGGAAFAATQLLGGEDPAPAPNTSSQPAAESPAPTAASGQRGAPPSETLVAVLNGTTFNGLAGTIADQLGAAGYRRGATITNPDQTLQASTVFYADGAQPNARRIARRLNIADVQPISAEAEALAPDADVVVLAGADQAP